MILAIDALDTFLSSSAWISVPFPSSFLSPFPSPKYIKDPSGLAV